MPASTQDPGSGSPETDPPSGDQVEQLPQAPSRIPSRPGKLERNPHKRDRVLRDLARGDYSIRAIARQHQVDERSVREFRDRHKAEIKDIAQELTRGLDGIWLTNKLERLAAMRVEFERAGDLEPEEGAKIRGDILRKAAEELGDIPNRTTLSFEKPVDINLRGVDPEDL